jgi:hypothetical protein
MHQSACLCSQDLLRRPHGHSLLSLILAQQTSSSCLLHSEAHMRGRLAPPPLLLSGTVAWRSAWERGAPRAHAVAGEEQRPIGGRHARAASEKSRTGGGRATASSRERTSMAESFDSTTTVPDSVVLMLDSTAVSSNSAATNSDLTAHGPNCPHRGQARATAPPPMASGSGGDQAPQSGSSHPTQARAAVGVATEAWCKCNQAL